MFIWQPLCPPRTLNRIAVIIIGIDIFSFKIIIISSDIFFIAPCPNADKMNTDAKYMKFGVIGFEPIQKNTQILLNKQ